jgi:F-actin capping protein alpha subunit
MYPSEDSAVSVFAKSGSIFVNISAEKVNLRNFWSGRMFSTWTIVVSTTKVFISGDIKVRFFVKSLLLCVRVR